MKRFSVPLVVLVALCLLSSAASAQQPVQRHTIWVGSETLGGYGRLEFHFYDNGTAMMVDARETSSGTYTRIGSSIALTFPGIATYSGTMNGNTMSGTARDDTRTWTWSVGFQQGR